MPIPFNAHSALISLSILSLVTVVPYGNEVSKQAPEGVSAFDKPSNRAKLLTSSLGTSRNGDTLCISSAALRPGLYPFKSDAFESSKTALSIRLSLNRRDMARTRLGMLNRAQRIYCRVLRPVSPQHLSAHLTQQMRVHIRTKTILSIKEIRIAH